MADDFSIAAGSPEPATVAALLDSLPSWFAQPDSNADYIESSTRMANFWARTPDGQAIGVLVLERHNPTTAEVHLVAVRPEWHRRGVGRGLLHAVETELKASGTRLLEVKTLGSAHPDPGYALTRLFYESVGFLPVEEFEEFWPGTPCLLMIKPLDSRGISSPSDALASI